MLSASTPGKTVTTRELAEAAGVSRSTISLALRDHPKISRAERERIQALARKMGYRTNVLVSAWMTHVRSAHTEVNKSLAIAVVTGLLSGSRSLKASQLRYLEGMRRRIVQLGYRLEEFHPAAEDMSEERLLGVLRARGVSGVVTGMMPQAHSALKGDWSDFSLAVIGLSLERPRLHRTTVSHYHAAQLATSELLRRGRRRIGFAMPLSEVERSENLFKAGYWVAMADADIAAPPVFCPEGDKWNAAAFRAWLRSAKPDAVLALGPQVLEWLRAEGRRVPEDVAFVDLYWDDEAPARAGIDHRAEEIGAAAVDLVAGQMIRNERGVPAVPRTIVIDGVWKDGPTV